MTKENIKAYYVGNTNKIIVVDSNNNTLVKLSIGDMVKIRKDIKELETLDGFYLYDGMKNVLTYDYEVKITDIGIDSDSGVATLGLDESGYFFPITVLEDLQDYEAINIAEKEMLEYEDIENIHSISNGDRLRVKPNVIIGEEYGLYGNVRYTPEQFSEYLIGYEPHELALPGEFVTVVRVDTSDNTVYCADEENGIALWYGIEMLQKSLIEEPKQENDNDDEIVAFMDKLNRDDEFLAFVEALREVAEFNGIDVPQIDAVQQHLHQHIQVDRIQRLPAEDHRKQHHHQGNRFNIGQTAHGNLGAEGQSPQHTKQSYLPQTKLQLTQGYIPACRQHRL